MHLLPLVLLTTAATSAATTSPTTATTQECIPFKASHGYTCLCTTNHCDSVAPLNRTALSDGKRAVIYQTAKETGDDVGDRLRRFELPLTTTTTQPTPARTITFDPTTVSYQLYFHFIKLRHTLLPYALHVPPSKIYLIVLHVKSLPILTSSYGVLFLFFLFSLSSAFPFFYFVGHHHQHHHHQPPPHRPTKQLKDLVTRSRTPPRLITIAWTIKRCFLSSIGVQMDLVLVLDVSPLHPVIFQRLLGAMMM